MFHKNSFIILYINFDGKYIDDELFYTIALGSCFDFVGIVDACLFSRVPSF